MDQNQLKNVLDYDPETGIFRWKKPAGRHGRIPAGTIAGCLDNQGYWSIKIGSKRILAHRLAWLFMTGEWPPEEIDHRNSTRSDNRISNLRLATKAQNMAHKGHHSNNRSGYKGIFPANGKWRAEIKVNGKRHYLGRHSTSQDASDAYWEVARSLLGEFAFNKDGKQ